MVAPNRIRDPNAPKRARAPQKPTTVYLVTTAPKDTILGIYRDAEDAFDKADSVEGSRPVKVVLPARGKVGTAQEAR